MLSWYYRTMAHLTGKNARSMPTSVILDQLNEPRPLPIGKPQFEAWSHRIISGALLTVDIDSQKFTLADQLLHLGPTESHKPDAYFIHCLRKLAINQTAIEIKIQIKAEVDARRKAEDLEDKEKLIHESKH